MKNTLFYSLAGLALLFLGLTMRQPQQPPPVTEATVQAIVATAIAQHVAEYHAPANKPAEQASAPELIAPPPNDTIYARDDNRYPGRFMWRWDGNLTPNTMFELRIWRPERDPVSLGAYDVRDARVISTITEEEAERFNGTEHIIHYAGDGVYWLDLNPASAKIVTPDYKTYVWSVAVVQVEPYRRIGAEAPPRPINIQTVEPVLIEPVQ
ncbi:MAG: hypothetical protein KJ077_08330 [Anaerolineae bacterium]|nr:hypothetical protein [Anaerolineae bacterium]